MQKEQVVVTFDVTMGIIVYITVTEVILMVVRNNLRLFMADKRVNIQDVSDATGITRKTISKIYHEISTQVRFDVLEKLCLYFNCDIGDLFYIEDSTSDK